MFKEEKKMNKRSHGSLNMRFTHVYYNVIYFVSLLCFHVRRIDSFFANYRLR